VLWAPRQLQSTDLNIVGGMAADGDSYIPSQKCSAWKLTGTCMQSSGMFERYGSADTVARVDQIEALCCNQKAQYFEWSDLPGIEYGSSSNGRCPYPRAYPLQDRAICMNLASIYQDSVQWVDPQGNPSSSAKPWSSDLAGTPARLEADDNGNEVCNGIYCKKFAACFTDCEDRGTGYVCDNVHYVTGSTTSLPATAQVKTTNRPICGHKVGDFCSAFLSC